MARMYDAAIELLLRARADDLSGIDKTKVSLEKQASLTSKAMTFLGARSTSQSSQRTQSARGVGRRATRGSVPPDFGVRVLRAIAREIERGDQSVKKDIRTP